MEGVGCFLTGLCGPGVGVTSYSENIGAIGLTKVTLITSSLFYMLRNVKKRVIKTYLIMGNEFFYLFLTFHQFS